MTQAMRLVLPLVLVGLAGPFALAHGANSEGAAKTTAVMAGIEAGDAHDHPLAPDEGPLREGWIFVLVAAQQDISPGLRVALVHKEGLVAAHWTLQPGQTRHFTTAIPTTGEYEVAVESSANETIRYGFYYDLSCNCAAKTVPWEVTPGLVLFNVDGRPGETVDARFPEREGLRFRVRAAEKVGDSGAWPEDFRVMGDSDTSVRNESAPKIHHLAATFPEGGRVYFFVETAAFMPGYDVEDLVITPAFRSGEAAAPAAHAGAIAGVLLAAALIRMARRR